MTKLYLDDMEMRLKKHGFGFTGSIRPRPSENLTQLVEIDDEVYITREQAGYLVVRRRDGAAGNQETYDAQLRAEIEAASKDI